MVSDSWVVFRVLLVWKVKESVLVSLGPKSRSAGVPWFQLVMVTGEFSRPLQISVTIITVIGHIDFADANLRPVIGDIPAHLQAIDSGVRQ